MVVCDSNANFIAVDVRWPGKAHDARVWRASDVNVSLQTGFAGDRYLLGDSAYPITTYLMKPYPRLKSTGCKRCDKKKFQYCCKKKTGY